MKRQAFFIIWDSIEAMAMMNRYVHFIDPELNKKQSSSVNADHQNGRKHFKVINFNIHRHIS